MSRELGEGTEGYWETLWYCHGEIITIAFGIVNELEDGADYQLLFDGNE